MGPLADAAIAVLLLVGGAFSLLGSVGLVRFSDVLLRLHGPTKAGTLGVGCILVASALYFSLTRPGISVHELLITLFLFLTAPVSAHLMAKSALFLRARRDDVTCLAGDCAPGSAESDVGPSVPAAPPATDTQR